MKLKKLIIGLAVGLAGLAAGSAYAQTANTYSPNGVLPFGGFNWSAAGAGLPNRILQFTKQEKPVCIKQSF